MRTSYIFLSFFIILMCSCVQDNLDNHIISDAKVFFNANANTLSLPSVSEAKTKSSFLMDVYPDWDNAIVSGITGSEIVKVPLKGATKIIATIVSTETGCQKLYKTNVSSNLILDYSNSIVPEMFVETNIDSRKLLSNPKISFRILSTIDGNIYKQSGEKGNTFFDAKQESLVKKCCCKKNYYFVGYRLAYHIATKGDTGCEDYGYIECPWCYYTYDLYMTEGSMVCPYCHSDYWSGEWICPTCGGTIYECGCANPEGSCPVCGRNSYNCHSSCGYKSQTGSGLCTCGDY